MEFRPVRLEDKAAIEHFTRPSGICNCDLAFANMYCWEGTYRSAWCVEEGFLLIRFYIDGSHHIGYMQPLGEGDFTHLIPRLEADARAAGQPLRISGLTPEGAAAVRRAHPEFGIWRTATTRITSTAPTTCATSRDGATSPNATISTGSKRPTTTATRN